MNVPAPPPMLTADPPPPEAAPVAPSPEAPPAAPAGPKLVGVTALKEISHADLTGAYTSGEWAPRQDEQVGVRYDGKLGKVSADKLQRAVEHGAEIVHPDVIQRATLEKRYGEHGTLGATVAGAARGLTLGLSDPIAVEAADAVGGEAAKAAVQDRLRYYKKEHPVASTVGEVGGMIAPALLTGGASADVEGAGLLAKAGRAVAAPTHLLGEVGSLAARGAAKVAGTEADSLFVRAAQSAAQHATRAGAEGAILGAGQEISEDSLDPDKNHALTAEKLFSAMGHGAIVNAAVGGALGLAGEGAGKLLDLAQTKASPFLAAQSKLQAFKALSPGAKFTREAEALVDGGREAVGEAMLRRGVIPTDGSLASAAITPEQMLPRIAAAREAAVNERNAILSANVEPLRELHGQQAWESIDPDTRLTREAQERVKGGTAAVGNVLHEYGVIPEGEAVQPDALLDKVQAAKEAVGEKKGQILAESGAKVNVSRIERQIESLIAPFRELAGMKPLVSSLETYRDDLLDKLYADFEAPKRFKIGVPEGETEAPRGHRAIEIKSRNEPFAIDPDAGLDQAGDAGWRIGPDGRPVIHEGEAASPITIDRTRPGHIGEGPMIDPGMVEGADVGPDGVGVRKAHDVGLKPGALTDEAPAAGRPIKISADEAATKKATREARADFEVPVQTLFAQKKALSDLVYKEAKALDPNMRISEMREIRRILSESETNAIGDAYEKAGNPAMRDALKKVNHDYQSLSIAEKAAERNVPRYATNPKLAEKAKLGTLSGLSYEEVTAAAKKLPPEVREKLLAANHDAQALGVAERAATETTAHYATNRNLGLSEYMAAGMSVASGHAFAAPAVALAHKVARDRGNALLAATFDRLSSLQAIAKKTAAVDSELNRGVKAFVSRAGGEAPKVRPREPVPERPASPAAARKAFNETVTRLTAASQGANFAAPIAPLAKHAPNVAANFAASAQKATEWLLSRVPPPPKFGSKTPSDQDVYAFNEEARAVENLAGTLANGLADGNLSRRQVDAIKINAPEIFTSVTKMIDARLQAAQASGKPLPWDVRRDVSLLFDIDTDWALTPAGGKVLQANATQDPQSSEQKPNRRSAPTTTPEATLMQTDAQRREGGQIR